MTEDINNVLTILEATLINEERPDYIEISYQMGFIFILLSKKGYKGIPLGERIKRISLLLEFDHEDILDKYPIIIECYDDTELDELFKLYTSMFQKDDE